MTLQRPKIPLRGGRTPGDLPPTPPNHRTDWIASSGLRAVPSPALSCNRSCGSRFGVSPLTEAVGVARTQRGESVLSRAARIVEAFGHGDAALTVTELARRSGLHIATASRIVEELVNVGWLQRDEKRMVRIGLRMWEVASRASPTLDLREAAMPVMEDLHSIVGHDVQLAVLEGDDVLFLERLTGPGAVINFTRVAGRLSLTSSSSGLLLLAYAPQVQQQRILAKPLDVFTEHSISSASQLRAALADVRRQGYAFLAGHVHPDATGIAVPIRDPQRKVVAALSGIVPNDDAARSRIPVLRAAAGAVSRAMEYPTPPIS